MSLLDNINSPQDVRALAAADLPQLAQDVRTVILETVSRNGGHLASNLGAVELTIALLRVFTPPDDRVVWDVGHQAYTWKLLTGRRDRFHTLRLKDGISGFVKPGESPCDAFIAGHAGTALSAALGMVAGRERQPCGGHVVAVIGDASITNGISLEALNNLEDVGGKVIVILNDNEMSIARNVGAFSRRLGRMLTSVRYNRIKAAAEAAGHRLRMTALRGIYHRLEQAVKSIWLQNAYFEEFGLRYIGPIDGHDFTALENALLSARDDKRSVLIHVGTQKGRGFKPAERTPSQWHGVGAFDLDTPPHLPASTHATYSQIMGETLTALAERDDTIVAITAAMCAGTGLDPFARRFPKRFFDVGICEAHAVVFAAGLAVSGYRPVLAVYATFLQRAVDCIMHDVCLQNLPVVFCIDRGGVVGSDGPTHHGIYDIPMLRCLPNLIMMQPADNAELSAMLKTALAHKGGPVAIRYPREPGPPVDVPPPEGAPLLTIGKAQVVVAAREDARPPVGGEAIQGGGKWRASVLASRYRWRASFGTPCLLASRKGGGRSGCGRLAT
ncbi:MAG: 1-deoxy-D-xylulose-5-phosphate synthase [Kiritimatiellaeota bacterium]|nr:1-deoxy-D-xylulose-5-phosphate synthase [Kiritimatiellota bacterium]